MLDQHFDVLLIARSGRIAHDLVQKIDRSGRTDAAHHAHFDGLYRHGTAALNCIQCVSEIRVDNRHAARGAFDGATRVIVQIVHDDLRALLDQAFARRLNIAAFDALLTRINTSQRQPRVRIIGIQKAHAPCVRKRFHHDTLHRVAPVENLHTRIRPQFVDERSARERRQQHRRHAAFFEFANRVEYPQFPCG
nr:hypothetical protein [Paraburkholderia bannensis]